MSRASLARALREGDRLLLDTTVLAAYLDTGDASHPVAKYLLDDLVASGRNPSIISMVTVMEILVRPLRATPPRHDTVLQFLRYAPSLSAVPLDLHMAQEAASLRASHRLAPPDALIVGSGLACQVAVLVTNDHAWVPKLRAIQARVRVCLLDSHLPFPS